MNKQNKIKVIEAYRDLNQCIDVVDEHLNEVAGKIFPIIKAILLDPSNYRKEAKKDSIKKGFEIVETMIEFSMPIKSYYEVLADVCVYSEFLSVYIHDYKATKRSHDLDFFQGSEPYCSLEDQAKSAIKQLLKIWSTFLDISNGIDESMCSLTYENKEASFLPIRKCIMSLGREYEGIPKDVFNKLLAA